MIQELRALVWGLSVYLAWGLSVHLLKEGRTGEKRWAGSASACQE